jgi:hypothetical protein
MPVTIGATRKKQVNSMGASNSIDKGKSMDANNSRNIRNCKVTISTRTPAAAGRPTIVMLKI